MIQDSCMKNDFVEQINKRHQNTGLVTVRDNCTLSGLSWDWCWWLGFGLLLSKTLTLLLWSEGGRRVFPMFLSIAHLPALVAAAAWMKDSWGKKSCVQVVCRLPFIQGSATITASWVKSGKAPALSMPPATPPICWSHWRWNSCTHRNTGGSSLQSPAVVSTSCPWRC